MFRRDLKYQYSQVKDAIEQDWTGESLPVAFLEKKFLRLSEDSLEDGCLMNDTVLVENDGPILENDLENVPPRYSNRMDLQQLLQSRIWKCKWYFE